MNTKVPIEHAHRHEWEIFHDKELKGTGFLSFYCKHCLIQIKVKRNYIMVEGE